MKTTGHGSVLQWPAGGSVLQQPAGSSFTALHHGVDLGITGAERKGAEL